MQFRLESEFSLHLHSLLFTEKKESFYIDLIGFHIYQSQFYVQLDRAGLDRMVGLLTALGNDVAHTS